MLDDNVCIYAPTDIKFSAQAHETRLAGGDQVIEDPVAYILMECTLIAK